MKVLICEEPGRLTLGERPTPKINPGEVLVRIRRVGVCGTDFHICEGKHPYLEYPRVMGHELSGEIAETSPGSKFELKLGQQVAINPYVACGQCVACRGGKPNCCMAIQVLGVHRDGGMCEFLAVPERNVLAANGVSIDQAAMLEFLAIGAHAVRRARLQPGTKALVVGTGPVGIGAMLFAKLEGVSVTALDTRAERLRFCREKLGIQLTVMPGEGMIGEMRDLTNGEFYDTVFDATGHAGAMMKGFDYVAHGGTYVLISVVKDQINFSDPEFHKREMSLLGSRNATAEDFQHVLENVRNGNIPTDLLNTHKAPLNDAANSIVSWMKPETGVIKALVEI
jgi:2-desacetyl-2-hydroxyethyl bacteriochlorophyllide A dehydrogenase